MPRFNAVKIKSAFPFFQTHENLVYLDNAATTQKPKMVIDRLAGFYEHENANVSRGIYPLSAKATQNYEQVRKDVASYLNATSPENIVFTHGATASINMVAWGFIFSRIEKGQNIVVSAMEHHANLLPWQEVCTEKQGELRVIPVKSDGELDLLAAQSLIDNNTILVAITHVSNVLGTINPIEELADMAKKAQAYFLIDAAQSAGLYPLDVSKSNYDFVAFSGHKMFAPLGTGVLFVNPNCCEFFRPLIFGGGAVESVSFQSATYRPFPRNMEAGTPIIAEVVGLGEALTFLRALDRDGAIQHIKNLRDHLEESLKKIDAITILGNPSNYAGLISFNLKGIHAHDVATFLGEDDIAVRAGHLCCEPLINELGEQAVVRASFSIYNTLDDVEKVIASLLAIKKFWK